MPKLIILVLLTMFYVSCKKDGTQSEKSETSKYLELQNWYSNEKAKSSGADTTLRGIKPDWSKVTTRQDSSKIIYEVEVENPNKVFLANQKIDISNASESYRLSQFRLIIIADQKTKVINGAFMNVLGDNSNESGKEVHYKKAGTFSGKIQYYGITGKYLNGWVYKNGKISKTIRPGQLIISNNVKTESDNCSITASPVYGTICAGGSDGGCSTSILGYDYTTTCNSFNTDNGGGSDGGGIGPAPENGGGGGPSDQGPQVYTDQEIFDLINYIQDPVTGDGIQLYLVANYKGSKLINLSTHSISSNSIEVGKYTLTPHYDPKGNLVFYAAVRLGPGGTNNGIEYLIKGSDLNAFKSNLTYYTASADLVYLNGIPSKSQVQLMNGNYFDGLLGMWGDALKAPQYWAYIATLYATSPTNSYVKNIVNQSLEKTFIPSLVPAGIGSTGRTIANNLTEQLAMREIMSNPVSGKIVIQSMSDASGRWNGWSKMSNSTAHGVEIHYNAIWSNGQITAVDDFKFVN